MAAVDRRHEVGWVQPGTSDLKGDQGWQQCKGDEKVGWVQPGDLTQAQLPTSDLNGGQDGSSG